MGRKMQRDGWTGRCHRMVRPLPSRLSAAVFCRKLAGVFNTSPEEHKSDSNYMRITVKQVINGVPMETIPMG